MSGHRSEGPAHDLSQYPTAERVLRSIIDDRASSSQISPSGELYRVIEEHYNPDRAPRAHSSLSALRSRRSDSIPPLSNPNASSRQTQDTPSARYTPPWLIVPAATSLPSLRSAATPRHPPNMSGANSAGGRYSRTRTFDWSTDRRRHGRVERNSNNDVPAMEPSREQRRPNRGTIRPRPRLVMDDILSEPFEGSAADLQAFLDFTHPGGEDMSAFSYSSSGRQRTEEQPEAGRQSKRRKIDSDRISSNFAGFRYGRYGQVEPGQLTMEIVHCDGGIFSDDGHQRYAEENILKNDRTVYCTEGSRCNIVLRHQGATVFTLKELVIKAPRSNYTSPVQEGMVFVAMQSDHILTRTTQYQIQYSSVRGSERQNLYNRIPVISIRHNEDGTTMTNAQIRARRMYNIGLDDEDLDVRVAQIPPEFHETSPPRGVTIEYGDEDSDEADAHEWHPDSWRSRNASDARRAPFDSESSDEDYEPFISRSDTRSRHRPQQSTGSRAEAAEAAQLATQEAVRAVGGEMLAPNARFFIERDKSKCTITFDPPVSGRFILLKMWSPQKDPTGNIDIQAVVAKGFAGPRYFPSVQLR